MALKQKVRKLIYRDVNSDSSRGFGLLLLSPRLLSAVIGILMASRPIVKGWQLWKLRLLLGWGTQGLNYSTRLES